MSTDVGGYYRSVLTVFDDTGMPATPATNVLTVTLPDKSTATPTVVVDSAGVLHADYQFTQEGLHKFVWTTISPTTSRTDYENAVNFRSAVGLGEMRDFLRLSDTSGDDRLRYFMQTATELAENIVGTIVVRTITNEHIPGYSKTMLRLPSGPLPSDDPSNVTSITSVWNGGPTWAGTDLFIYAASGTVEPQSMIGFWWGPWKATYTAGRLIVDQSIIMAVKIIVSDLWSNQRGLLNDPLVPGLAESAEYEARIPHNYDMPAYARSLLEGSDAKPGFA